ncbi:MAG TPA: hypothetical protein RMH99_29215 [Sandaracinaceae bacterium LLY-WYZ-13_1]|nr:hypothetical protein [Sandaracinaceae bacterium LLY-WYZ-13_1]
MIERRVGSVSWLAQPWLLFPERVERGLRRVEAAGLVERTPNRWQIGLGVLRMWHRLLFRSETVGTCALDPVRSTWRARLLEHRALRFPFLVAERAIAPLDFSGLASSPERIIRHLLGAHHDGLQFAYDLALLSAYPDKLEELLERARRVVDGRDPRGGWLRDLVVYEGYHERLLEAVEQVLAQGIELPPEVEADPDISFLGYLRWCAAQPETPEATLEAWRRGEYTMADGWSRATIAPPRPRPVDAAMAA